MTFSWVGVGGGLNCFFCDQGANQGIFPSIREGFSPSGTRGTSLSPGVWEGLPHRIREGSLPILFSEDYFFMESGRDYFLLESGRDSFLLESGSEYFIVESERDYILGIREGVVFPSVLKTRVINAPIFSVVMFFYD